MMKIKKEYWVLAIIVAVAFFLRFYNAEKWFDFTHDGDLYSWVFKDIAIDHHIRLIGQVTSTPGIYIGPLFYYSVIPFFLLFNMEPVGAVYTVLILGLLTTISFYWIFKKLFSLEAGLIAASLHGFLLSRVFYDRWVVPTVTTSLWEVWYFYCVVMIFRGNFNVFPILGALVGLIWHISFSLTPSLVGVLVAFIFAKKMPTIKQLLLGVVGFFATAFPLFLFEFKHNFSQYRSFITSFQVDQGEKGGLEKLNHVIAQVSGNAYSLFFHPDHGETWARLTFFTLLLVLGVFLAYKRYIPRKLLIVLFAWILGMVGFFSSSSKIITEYYFSNINMLVLAIVILFLSYLYMTFKVGRGMVIIFIVGLGIWSIYWMFTSFTYNFLGYQERKAVAEYIAQDAKINSYPCVSVSYVARRGYEFGFRYVFYLQDLHVNKPASGSPIYSIVAPHDFIEDSRKVRIGNYAVIPEGSNKSKEEIAVTCSGVNENVEGDLFGYTE